MICLIGLRNLELNIFAIFIVDINYQKKIRKECGIVNLDDNQGPGTHWVCYRNIDSFVEYFDPFDLIMPDEIYQYLLTSGKKRIYSQDEIQNRDSVLCGYWCLYYLNERQNECFRCNS